MPLNLSPLRIAGICAGITLLVMFLFQLRQYRARRVNIWLIFTTGLFVLVGSCWPASVGYFSELLRLNNLPGGRLLTLLGIGLVVAWCVLLREKSRNENRHQQMLKLVGALAVEQMSPFPEEPKDDSILVILPSYNEAENLPGVLAKLPKKIGDRAVFPVVVDDGSVDDSKTIAEKCGVAVARHVVNCGGGAALKTGFLVAQKYNIPIIVTMDSDGQHDPNELESMVRPICDDEADIVVGSRVLGSSDRYSSLRITGVYLFSWLISFLTGGRITDCASGFRAMRRSVLEQFRLVQPQYHTAELIIEASKQGARIVERPIHIGERHSGESKKGRNSYYAFSFLRTVVRTWIR